MSQTDSWTGEFRQLYRAGRWNVTAGLGHFRSSRDRTETLDLELPFPPFTFTSVEVFSDDPLQTNAYLYSTVDLRDEVTLHLGASADFYETQLFERRQLNPKLGVSWAAAPGTVVRSAVFRALHRALVSSQTIEPTHVAGFNQFYAGLEGEDAWRFGVALDQKFNARLFGGAEVAWRNLTVPIEFPREEGRVVERFDRDEQFARAYVYWAPDDRASVTAEYIFERFGRDAASSGDENILELRTHRLPLGVRYFSPIGLSAEARAAWVNQRGRFAGLAFEPTGEDRFWIVDAAVRWRLPRRYGRVAIEIRNLFDEQFRFQDTDPGNPVVKPGRQAAFTFTLGI
jgi:hypothetical protein